jgi:TfoX/Sxy family transcriptional regulator of competence genes
VGPETPAVARTPEDIFQGLAEVSLRQPGVGMGKMFSSSSVLNVNGKIFVMLVKGRLVVKLPRARVDELVASGVGTPFDPGRGRLMKEWIAVDVGASRRWRSLVAEAHGFVASAARSSRRPAR